MLDELLERVDLALDRLVLPLWDAIRTQNQDEWRRLSGKIEGVRLVRSYIEEEIRMTTVVDTMV